jgi:aromatic ring-cleaving dioxygenase
MPVTRSACRSLLLRALTVSVALFGQSAAHSQPGMSQLSTEECSKDNINFQSYHIHVIYWGSNKNSTNAALTLRKNFINKFELDEEADACPFQPSDPEPDRKTICIFPVDSEPAGPFLSAQYSFFLPLSFLQPASAWVLAHRVALDVFVHPNSGCSLKDHVHYGMWSGNKWEIDPYVFLD